MVQKVLNHKSLLNKNWNLKKHTGMFLLNYEEYYL